MTGPPPPTPDGRFERIDDEDVPEDEEPCTADQCSGVSAACHHPAEAAARPVPVGPHPATAGPWSDRRPS